MTKKIYSAKSHHPSPLKNYDGVIEKIRFSLDPALNRCALTPSVKAGDEVDIGATVAESPRANLHSPVKGKIIKADKEEIIISPFQESYTGNFPLKSTEIKNPAELTREIGLVGMGGSMFPYSVKLKACDDIHTLIINAVECEPLIEIDEALLIEKKDYILKACGFLKESMDLKNIFLAVKKKSARYMRGIFKNTELKFVEMRNYYPAGAEKLIIKKLLGKIPAPGKLPFHYGFLVSNAASLFALGRRLKDGVPSVERPLTLYFEDAPPQNIIVPIGISAAELLKHYGINYDRNKHIIIAGGKMMGVQVKEDFSITKGANALIIITPEKRLFKEEIDCILCGSCHDACPLSLHPSKMAEMLKEERVTPSLKTHLKECFLCAACSAVCPAEIPLAYKFKEGKKWLT